MQSFMDPLKLFSKVFKKGFIFFFNNQLKIFKDEEFQRERELHHLKKPKNISQGIAQGTTSLAIGIFSGVKG